MLYNLDMPSFDVDEAQTQIQTLSASPFNSAGQLRGPEKLNGSIRSGKRRSTKGSSEDSENLYIHAVQNGGPLTNGDINGMDLTNGRSSTGSREKTSIRNESSISLTGTTNGYGHILKPQVNGSSSASTHRASISSTSATIPGSREAVIKPVANTHTEHKTIAIPPPISTNPQSTGPLTYGSSLMPEPDTRRQSSPHRFSSPPAYPAQSAPGTTATTPSAPGPPTPVAPPLKHRHTLQVPRIVPGRSSRDGFDDGVYSAGRFSPTTAARRGSMTLARRNTRSIHSDMPHDEIPHDETAARWAEVHRQRRAEKRRRKDEEDDDRVVVGTKVDASHVNWVTAYNMLTGIRFTVSRTNAKIDRALTDQDFQAKHKFSFDITGNELTPSAKYDFKFKDYAPWVFRHLRAKFKLDPADYLMSLTSKYILSELGSPGKSGSFFYFSRDYKYIIKTIHHAEHKFLRKILKDYYEHVEQNPNTLLSQFYGLHRVKIPYGRKIHFVVMNNLFPPHRDIHQTFDLKGSTIGRDFKEEDLARNPRATLKDLNWLRRNLHLEFGPEKKRLFIEQMERDVELLKRLKIMDYSLLVGIHDLEKGNQENLRDKTLQVFQPGGESSPDGAAPSTLQQLMRTPSKLENQRKARELRQTLKQEKPIPMGQVGSGMPELEENAAKKDFIFYSDDGGFQATHDDNAPGDEIYYLGIIDCLTHYGMVKRLEHFWKGLSHDKQQISPVPSYPYGNRFVKFITGVTKTREEGEREAVEELGQAQVDAPNSPTDRTSSSHHRTNSGHMYRTITENTVVQKAETQAMKTEARGASEETVPERTLSSISRPSNEQERLNGDRGMTLPIVDEVGESSSTGGRSNIDEKDERPPTPPKDSVLSNGHNDKTPTSSIKQRVSSESKRNKALPSLPKVHSPEQMDEKDSLLA